MLLEVKNLKKSFPIEKDFAGRPTKFVHAVNDVSFSLNKGDSLGLVGESGCGKTTLARLLMKIYPIDSGEIFWNGKDISKPKKSLLKEYRKSLQMVFQDPFSSLDPRWTVFRILNEALTADPKKYPTRSQKEKRVQDMLKAVGLTKSGMLNRYPHEFSGGERQRIAIARALMISPEMLILDEAVSSLDVLVQDQILDLLADLQKEFNLTYLFISHNLKVIRRVCSKVAVMYRGKIVEYGPVEDIFQNPQHAYTKHLLKAAISYESSDFDSQKLEGELKEVSLNHFVLS